MDHSHFPRVDSPANENRSCRSPDDTVSSRSFSMSGADAPYHSLTAGQRLRLSALGLGLAALLVMALLLTPDARGHGTHQQLGLPPCTFKTLFGLPCPSCGMTTSWAYLVRGQIKQAVAANAGGTMLAMLAAIAAIWCFASANRGRKILGNAALRALVLTIAAVVIAAMVQWMFRLGILDFGMRIKN